MEIRGAKSGGFLRLPRFEKFSRLKILGTSFNYIRDGHREAKI
jgi:hypothetical protein